MIGSFLTRTLALVLGYAYPAYECFKTVELNKPEIEQLRFWCQYWILVAALTVFERVGESFISWLPMYSEAKVLFFVYLWYPKTRGTAYVYETFFRPYVAKHETEIDRNLLELRTRAGDMVVMYSQRIASYGQTRFYEILQFVASQSQSQSSRPHPAQTRQQPQQARPTVPTTATRQPAALQPPQQLARAPPSPLRPPKSQLHEPTKAGPPSSVGTLSSAAQTQTSGNATSQPSSLDDAAASTSSPTEAEAMQVDVANVTSSDASTKDLNPPPQETPMEESIRVTRGRLRRRAATGGA